jgi:hypothetical protein
MNKLLKIFTRDTGSNDPFMGLNLGDEAQDTLTGFQGIIVATNRNISGCDQIALQPTMADGKFEDSRWFDIERMALVEANKVEFTKRRTGADTSPPSRTPTT